MPTIHRLTGRFFSALISLTLALTLPAANGASPKTLASPAPTLCQVSDTVYRADGSPAQGTVLITWPAFTTAAGQAVTPGSLTVTLDASGGFNANLAPNTGASPTGTYYRAVFKLNDGTTDSEYWVVPNTSTTTIGAIRSKLVPANQAAQFLTRDFADSTYVALASTQTITGLKTFASSPTVPTPQNPTDAANKAYVDANAGAGNLASPPPIGNVTPNSATFTTVNGIPNAAAFPGADACAKINNAATALGVLGGVIDARGFSAAQTCSTSLSLPNNAQLLISGTWTFAPGDFSISASGADIEFGPGTYSVPSGNLHITGNYNTLHCTGDVGSCVISLADDGTSASHTLWIDGGSHITVQGMTVTQSNLTTRLGYYGTIRVGSTTFGTITHDVKLLNNEVPAGSGIGIYVAQTDGVLIQGNRVHDVFADGIHLNRGTVNARVIENEIYNTSDDALALISNVSDGSGNYPQTGFISAVGNTIHHVHLTGNNGNGISIVGAHDVDARANVIHDIAQSGINIANDGFTTYYFPYNINVEATIYNTGLGTPNTFAGECLYIAYARHVTARVDCKTTQGLDPSGGKTGDLVRIAGAAEDIHVNDSVIENATTGRGIYIDQSPSSDPNLLAGFWANLGYPLPPSTVVKIANNGITRSGGVVTVTTTSYASFQSPAQVTLAGLTGCTTSPNGTFAVTSTDPMHISFTFTQAGTNETCGGSNGTASGQIVGIRNVAIVAPQIRDTSQEGILLQGQAYYPLTNINISNPTIFGQADTYAPIFGDFANNVVINGGDLRYAQTSAQDAVAVAAGNNWVVNNIRITTNHSGIGFSSNSNNNSATGNTVIADGGTASGIGFFIDSTGSNNHVWGGIVNGIFSGGSTVIGDTTSTSVVPGINSLPICDSTGACTFAATISGSLLSVRTEVDAGTVGVTSGALCSRGFTANKTCLTTASNPFNGNFQLPTTAGTPGFLVTVGTPSGSTVPLIYTDPSTIGGSLPSGSGNQVLATPAGGGPGISALRPLVSADIPNNAANTTGTAGGLSNPITESQVTGLTAALATIPNLAAPPPIGNVTPNSATFTTVDGITNAAAFPGADACAKINAAIATLASGGSVDARGFTGTQVCATTLTLPKNVNLKLQGVHLTLNACPGINVTGPGSWLEGGSEATVGYSTGYASTVIKSGSACPMLQNILTATDGLTISNLEMDCNSVGTFAAFLPISGDNTFENVNAHHCTVNNIYAPGGLNKMHDGFYQRAGCDGIVWGTDGSIDGKIESTYNGCDGLHVVGGGNTISVNTLDLNTGRGAYLDGRIPGDWTASTAYQPGCYSEGVCGSITPHTGNPGNYNYKVISCTGDCKTGTVAPAWTQTGGALITDNHVTWLATGNLYASNGYGNHITGQFPYNGLEQLRLEGDPAAFAAQNSIVAPFTNSAGNSSTSNSMGLHLLRATATDIDGGSYFGSALNKKNDLGGLVIDDSFHTKISNFHCQFAHNNCVHVTNGSGYTFLGNVEVYDNSDATTAGDARYAILSDSGTLYTTEGSGTMVIEDRSPAYSLGAKDYSTGAFPFGYQSNVAGNITPDNFGQAAGFIYEQDAGQGHNPYIPFPDHLDLGGAVAGSPYAPLFQFNQTGLTFYSPSGITSGVTVSAPNATFTPFQMTWPTTPGTSGQCLVSGGGGTTPMTWGPCSAANLSSPPPIGNTTPNTINATALSFQNIPGVAFLVSRYATIQAAINAAYNSGAVQGTVIDDRTSPYTGPGFILYDSVTLKLAATTYTINAAVTYNNSNNVVTAGIIALPGARLIGASTSSNHGTIITAANGLNSDLIATSTVGTGIGSTAQWWHWGGFENLRVTGNGANQTAGNCFNIENMGEVAFLRTIEVSGCFLDNILFTGASATPSDIANITTNSAGRYGFNFNNLSGVAVVHGLSGDSNTTSLLRLNGGQSGTLTILGFKTEEEISGQDPLITIDQTGQNGAQPSLYIVGGYTFGRTGVNDVIKYVNGTAGTTPFISVNNFYVQNYVNAVNDVVNGRTTAAANMNKVPFYYGPTGGFLSAQAFTLDLNTFIQSPHSGNGILTEIFGTTSSNETVVAASGTSTSVSTGGIGFRMPNRTIFGQSPELFAKMTYAFPGGIPNTQQWEFIPAKAAGDNSTRWLGDPSYRWDEVYAADVNTTNATIGTLNVTACNGCGTGTHLVAGTMQGATATLTGNSADQTVFTATLPAGTFAVGAGVHCYAKWTHPTSSGAITYKWTLGTTTWAYGSYTSASQNISSDIEILTITSLASQSVNLSPVIAGTAIGVGGSYGNTGAENLANADTIRLTFNAGSSDQVKGATFYCQTVQ